MTSKKAAGTLTILTLLLAAGTAVAQDDPYECDDRYAPCGAPQQSGGGGGGGGGSILINNTDLGETYQYADDFDDDGVEDPYDLCPWVADSDQIDDDGDQIGTACDNCPQDPNADQANLDGDALGDLCDDDRDGDGVENGEDLCPDNPDPLQKNSDEDEWGDACDGDMDEDGIPNLEDNCPLVYNPDQANDDPDYWGNACDDDDDGDGIRNTYDNCISIANHDQDDLDADAIGDICDADKDGDAIVNDEDNCPAAHNPGQDDADRDGVGEACDDAYCFVVEGDVDNCLDPTDPFTVYGPAAEAEVGETVRLRLFANHINQPFRYAWDLVDTPKGSKATIEYPAGAVSISTPYEYHYLADRVVTFTPDKPGTYEFHVYGELVWEDVVTGEQGATAEASVILEVFGDARTAACSTIPFSLAPWWLLLPAIGFARARRRGQSREEG
ncbi:MAG: thrombospondin type 3 repeat-containing protein [Deltaproteobacteria bacterium]|nr:thrombospondin type 3 repeat-containing protein [Deltaproteobacteria bacterium]